MIINIVTVCSRPEYLAAVSSSIFKDIPQNLDVKWHIVLDTNKVSVTDPRIPKEPDVFIYRCSNVGPGAGLARNVAFDWIADGYIHIIDDDNIVHPNFYPIMATLADKFPENIIVGDQVMKDGSLRLHGSQENMRKCHVDSANFIWHAKLMGNIRWTEIYECDGVFVEAMASLHSDKFVFVNTPISFYNYLS